MNRFRRLRKVLLALVALYLLLVAGLFLLQRSLIYHGSRVDPPNESLLARLGVEARSIPTPEGETVGALWLPPPDDDAPVVLIGHGNAGHVLDWQGKLRGYRAIGCGALLFDPPGYGWSTGKLDEAGVLAAARAAFGWLQEQELAPERIFLHGVSLGSGMVVPIAAEHEVGGLILQAAFTSLADAAADAMPFVPARWMLRDRYPSLEHADAIAGPVLILHGTADRTVRFHHAETWKETLGDRATLHAIEGQSHNGMEAWTGYWPTVEEFVFRRN